MERVETRRVPLAEGGRVKLATGIGQVKVVPTDGNRLELTLNCISHDQKSQRAREVLNRVQLVMRRSGDTVSIDVVDRKSGGMRLMNASDLDLQFEIAVPAHCSLELFAEEGSVQVGNLAGNMHAVLNRGRISFGQIDGDVYAQTGYGDVRVSRCTGSVDLQTEQGHVHVGTVSGHANLQTGRGNIVVQSAYNTVRAHTRHGDLVAQLARISGPVKLRSDAGSIRATLNPEENCSVAVQAARSKVASEIPLVLANSGKNMGRLVGEQLGGGPRVDIRVPSNGRVQVVQGAPLFAETPRSTTSRSS